MLATQVKTHAEDDGEEDIGIFGEIGRGTEDGSAIKHSFSRYFFQNKCAVQYSSVKSILATFFCAYARIVPTV